MRLYSIYDIENIYQFDLEDITDEQANEAIEMWQQGYVVGVITNNTRKL